MTAPDSIGFECHIDVQGQALHVNYTVRNAGGREIALLNRIRTTRLDGSPVYAAENVYIERDDVTLVVRKTALALPEGLAAAEAVVPSVSRVPDGWEFSERLVLAVPVPVCHPFTRVLLADPPGAEVLADAPAECTAVRFLLEGFYVPAQMRFKPVSPAFPRIFAPWPPLPEVALRFTLRRDQILPAPLPVLAYRVVAPD